MKYENISVTAFIPWDGKVLLAQRANNDNFLPGYWEQVGGKVYLGETQEEAVVREVREEAGVDIEPLYLYNEFEFTLLLMQLMSRTSYLLLAIQKSLLKKR